MLPAFGIHRILSRSVVLALLFLHPEILGQSRISPHDSSIVYQHLQMADEYVERSMPDSAILFAKLAQAQSRSKNFREGLLWSMVKVGDAYIVGDSLEQAYTNAELLISLASKSRDSSFISLGHLHKAQVSLFTDNYDSAIYWFEKSLKGNHLLKNKKYLAVAYNDLGYTWGRKEEYEKMTDYCLKSLAIYDELDKPAGSARALGNISTMYYEMGDRAKALEYGRKSLYYREKARDINRLALSCCNFTQLLLGSDSNQVNKYAALCEKYSLESGDEARIIHSLVTLSAVNRTHKRIPEGFAYELKAIGLLEKNQSDLIMLSVRYISAANYSMTLKMDSSVTIGYFNRSIELAKRLGLKKNLRDAYLNLSDFYKNQNDYVKALRNYVMYKNYRDSLSTVERTTNIAELEAKYQTAKKDVEIRRLKYQEELRKLEIERQNALLAGNKLLAREKQAQIELIGKQNEIKEAALKQQEEELIRQKLLASNKEQEYLVAVQQQKINEENTIAARQFKVGGIIGIGLLLAILAFAFSRFQLRRQLAYQRSMQTMRNTIASDLHDDVGASLSNINILNELTKRNIYRPEKVREYLGKTAEDIRQVSEGIGDIVWSINPIHDQMDQLLIRMKRYASDLMDAKNIQYTIKFSQELNDLKWSMDKRRDLYLFFKEAINNLVKYSGTKEATIEMGIKDGYAQLNVVDHGVGFDINQAKQGNGLQNMEQRAGSLGGRVTISSVVGKGTYLQLKIPIQE